MSYENFCNALPNKFILHVLICYNFFGVFKTVGNSANEAMKAHVIDARITWVSREDYATTRCSENQSGSRILFQIR